MRQKYRITRDQGKDKLKIKEFAVIDKDLKNVKSSMLLDEHFCLLCEENYDGTAIARSISEGTIALITALRTRNLFPIEPYAAKIAESVVNLYDSNESGSVELFFDDMDLFQTEPPAAAGAH